MAKRRANESDQANNKAETDSEKNKRMTQEQIQSVIDEIIGYLVVANGYVTIRKTISAKYSITERQAETYIAKAREEIVVRFKPELETEKVLIGLRYNELYKKGWSTNDFRECRKVMDSYARLIGANAPEDLNVKSTVNLDGLPQEEIDALVAISRKLG